MNGLVLYDWDLRHERVNHVFKKRQCVYKIFNNFLLILLCIFGYSQQDCYIFIYQFLL